MPFKDNGPEPPDPHWGKVWLSDYGAELIAELVASGAERHNAMIRACGRSAVESALYALHGKRLATVEALERRIAGYCPAGTVIEIYAGGILINGVAIGYTLYRVEDALEPAAHAALVAAPVEEIEV